MGDQIRIVKSGDYSLISNYHLKDKRLSWYAKGLLSAMLALSGEYTIDELKGLSSSNGRYGTDGFAELEQHGYLTWKQCRDDAGCPMIEYKIYEKPIRRDSSSYPMAEIMNPEDMPGSLKHIDEEERQKLCERLAVDKMKEKHNKNIVESAFQELCRRDEEFRKRMTQKAFEKVCDMVLDQQEEFTKYNLMESTVGTFRWTLAINEAFDNIEKGLRQKIFKTNEEARV